MIERYQTPAMAKIWSRQAKYQKWMEVELAILRGWSDAGIVPSADCQLVESRAGFDLARCDEIEATTRHDLMAFVRNLSETVSGVDGLSREADALKCDPSRWIHFGVTSYDVIDTALGMMLRESCDVLMDSIDALTQAIESQFEKNGQLPCIGRTHGIHAEPVTFGHKLHGWWHELGRAAERIAACRTDVAVGKVSGAVGIHAHCAPDVEKKVCEALGLKADPSSTQIVSRDRHASLLATLAVLAGTSERIATELRNLQRTEILEVQEEFAPGQTGSSAMPHKRNPWNSETVCGLARIVRGNAHAMLESVSTWHERDLTNSSLERIVFPDTFHLVDFILNRLTKILSGLVVQPENMARNLRQMGDLVFSEHVMVALVKAGLSREGAYHAAQRCAAQAWQGEDFKHAVTADPEIASLLSAEVIEECFDLGHHLRHAPRCL